MSLCKNEFKELLAVRCWDFKLHTNRKALAFGTWHLLRQRLAIGIGFWKLHLFTQSRALSGYAAQLLKKDKPCPLLRDTSHTSKELLHYFTPFKLSATLFIGNDLNTKSCRDMSLTLLNCRGRSLIKSRLCKEGSGTVICCLAGVWEVSVTKQLLLYVNK